VFRNLADYQGIISEVHSVTVVYYDIINMMVGNASYGGYGDGGGASLLFYFFAFSIFCLAGDYAF
jgi:hypothetical protein